MQQKQKSQMYLQQVNLKFKCSHIKADNTRKILPHIYSAVHFHLSESVRVLISVHLPTSLHQPPSEPCLYVSPLQCHNTYTSRCCSLAHVFVMLLQWHLTFSCSFPKCQLIIFTPCNVTASSISFYLLLLSATFIFYYPPLCVHVYYIKFNNISCFLKRGS